MPQLWTETFISQYFWLLLILLTFYYFMATKVIPVIADAMKDGFVFIGLDDSKTNSLMS